MYCLYFITKSCNHRLTIRTHHESESRDEIATQAQETNQLSFVSYNKADRHACVSYGL